MISLCPESPTRWRPAHRGAAPLHPSWPGPVGRVSLCVPALSISPDRSRVLAHTHTLSRFRSLLAWALGDDAVGPPGAALRQREGGLNMGLIVTISFAVPWRCAVPHTPRAVLVSVLCLCCVCSVPVMCLCCPCDRDCTVTVLCMCCVCACAAPHTPRAVLLGAAPHSSVRRVLIGACFYGHSRVFRTTRSWCTATSTLFWTTLLTFSQIFQARNRTRANVFNL